MICPYCRETIQDGAIKCRYCGSMLTSAPFESSPISADEFRAFVGNNADYYIGNFSKFSVGGTENFSLTWNWSAFFFGFIWMLYRRMYLQAVITFVIFCVPGFNLLLHIAVGCFGNYLYFQHARNKILEVKQRVSPEYLYPALQQIGGVHGWAITVGILVAIFVFFMFWAFFAAIIHLFGFGVNCHQPMLSI